MTPRQEFKLCFGIARQRAWQEDVPDNYAGIPKRYRYAVEKAMYAIDLYERRSAGRILQILKDKRNPNSRMDRAQYNCRCTMLPITETVQ